MEQRVIAGFMVRIFAWMRSPVSRKARAARPKPVAVLRAEAVPRPKGQGKPRLSERLAAEIGRLLAKRKPKDTSRRGALLRRWRTIRARLVAVRDTLHGRRFVVVAIAFAMVLAGAGYAGFLAWQGAKLRAVTVAVVDGVPITRSDLFAEAIAEGADPSRLDQAARQRLLDRIVDRRLLTAAAGKQGIASEERYKALRQRSEEMLLSSFLLQRLAGKPDETSDEDARRFRESQPFLFAQRQNFVLDAINCALSAIPEKPGDQFDTLDGTETYLKQSRQPFHRGIEVIDSASLPPDVAAGLVALPRGKVFILPRGDRVFVATVTDRVPSTLPVEAQLSAAREILSRKSAETRAENAIAELRSKAKIEYVKQ